MAGINVEESLLTRPKCEMQDSFLGSTNQSTKLNSSTDKFLAVSGFLLLLAGLVIVLVTPSASGYEISMYHAYPLALWLLIGTAHALGVVLLLRQAFGKTDRHLWWMGVAVCALSNMVFLLLPFFHGYAVFGRDDTLSHVGQMRDIALTGKTGASDFYPMTHILGAGFADVLGISLQSVPYIFNALFYGVWFVGVIVLARCIAPGRGVSLIVVMLAAPLLFGFYHTSIHPSFLSVYLLPYLILLYQCREVAPIHQLQYSVLALVLLFAITYWHPVTTLFLIALFIAVAVTRALFRRFAARPETHAAILSFPGLNAWHFGLIATIAFSAWYLSFSTIHRHIREVWDWLTTQTGTPMTTRHLEKITDFDLSFAETMYLAANRWAPLVMVLGIAIASLFYVFLHLRSGRTVKAPMLVLYGALFLVGAIALVAQGLVAGGESLEPVRASRFALVMAPLLSGLVIGALWIDRTGHSGGGMAGSLRNILPPIGIVVMVVVVASLYFANIYPSPRLATRNIQVTRMELAGSAWLAQMRNPYTYITGANPVYIERFENYLYGVDTPSIVAPGPTGGGKPPEGVFSPRVEDEWELASHFGYEEVGRLGEGLTFVWPWETYRYMCFTQFDLMYPGSFPGFISPKRLWDNRDFSILRADSSASHIYDNGDFQVWVVYRENTQG